jgi:hypothetical protein
MMLLAHFSSTTFEKNGYFSKYSKKKNKIFLSPCFSIFMLHKIKKRPPSGERFFFSWQVVRSSTGSLRCQHFSRITVVGKTSLPGAVSVCHWRRCRRWRRRSRAAGHPGYRRQSHVYWNKVRPIVHRTFSVWLDALTPCLTADVSRKRV